MRAFLEVASESTDVVIVEFNASTDDRIAVVIAALSDRDQLMWVRANNPCDIHWVNVMDTGLKVGKGLQNGRLATLVQPDQCVDGALGRCVEIQP